MPCIGKHKGWQAVVKDQTHKWSLMIGNNVKAIAAGRPVLVVFFGYKGGPSPPAG